MWTGAASFRQNDISPSTPYVFYYRIPKQDIEICVDCRKYGNFARFVRRSCKPNSEVSIGFVVGSFFYSFSRIFSSRFSFC